MALVKQSKSEPSIGEGAIVKMSTIGDFSAIGKDSRIMGSTIGRHCDIEERNLLQKATIGDMTYTGSDVGIMWAHVGKYCCIARMVEIGGNEHNYHAAAMMPSYRVKTCLMGKLARHPDEDPISIGNDVWIGRGATIARKPGLTVGDGAVIGAGAVVTKSIPPYAIAVGIPAKVIGYRFDEATIEKLLALQWWDWPDETVAENWGLLSCDLTDENFDELIQRFI